MKTSQYYEGKIINELIIKANVKALRKKTTNAYIYYIDALHKAQVPKASFTQ